ncbi:MAG: hypothetical protein AAGF12_38560, partial [Myxococcota bacterium]
VLSPVGICIIVCGGLLFWVGDHTLRFTGLSAVCAGEGEEANPNYAGAGPHPIVVATELPQQDGRYQVDINTLREAWTPRFAHQTELILCLGAVETESVAECGEGEDRIRVSRRADLYVVHTGQRIKSGRIVGDEPGPCGGEPGTEPDEAHLSEFVREFVEAKLP